MMQNRQTAVKFNPPGDAIRAQAAIDIAALPEQVAAVYRDVEKWDETFPATIQRAQVIETGANWQKIEVTHKTEGCVPNTLIFLSSTEVGLEESKRRFNANFLNRFEPEAGGATHYVISAYISLKGVYKILKPLIAGYVRQKTLEQMENYVLVPLKKAAEGAVIKEPG